MVSSGPQPSPLEPWGLCVGGARGFHTLGLSSHCEAQPSPKRPTQPTPPTSPLQPFLLRSLTLGWGEQAGEGEPRDRQLGQETVEGRPLSLCPLPPLRPRVQERARSWPQAMEKRAGLLSHARG